MNKFFITFAVGRAFRGQYVLVEIPVDVEGNPMEIARLLASDHFGNKWGFIYPEEDLRRQIIDHGLQYLLTIKVDRFGRYKLEKINEDS